MKKLFEILNNKGFSEFIENPNKTIIDVGCGKGRLLLEIQANKLGFNKFYALDLQFKGMTLADIHNIFFQEYVNMNNGGHYPTLEDEIKPILKSNFHFHKTDLEQLNSSEFQEFDLVVLSNVLHLFCIDRAKNILDFFYSKLKINGLLFIRIANEHHKGWEENHTAYEGPKWGLTKEQLENLIEDVKIKYEDNGESNRQIIFEKKSRHTTLHMM